MGIQKSFGRMLGAAIAPAAFMGSLIRGERLFHPDGIIYRAEVRPIAEDSALESLAERLAGTALVRLSGGWWRWPQGRHAPDTLGMAIRFRMADEVTPRSLPGDQDLTFVTASSLSRLAMAPFRTKVDDFLGNRYYALLPFTLEGVGTVHLRLAPKEESPAGLDRRSRLALAVTQGTAVLRLELRVDGGDERWLPIADVELREQLLIDDERLVFDPGSSAMGLVPYGMLQWMRPMVYAASEAGLRLRR